MVEASLNETGGGEGVEVLNNEPYENIPLLNGQFNKGQYTKKIYHLASKVPGIVKWIMPKGALEILEEAWNAYPYCKTVLTNPGYMKGNALIKVETYHKADRGDSENVHELTPEQLKMRKVVKIDIANDAVPSGDYKANEDPAKFKVFMSSSLMIKKNLPIPCHTSIMTTQISVKRWPWSLEGRLAKDGRAGDDSVQVGHHRVQVDGTAKQGGKVHYGDR